MAVFSGCKVGDKVFDVGFGWGTIVVIKGDELFPILVDFDNNAVGALTYTTDGKHSCGQPYPTLFWDEVKIVPPERPDRCECVACFRIKITKEGEVYNGYQNDLFLLNQHHACEKGESNGTVNHSKRG